MHTYLFMLLHTFDFIFLHGYAVSRNYPIRHKYTPSLLGDDEVFLDACEALLTMTDDDGTPDRYHPG